MLKKSPLLLIISVLVLLFTSQAVGATELGALTDAELGSVQGFGGHPSASIISGNAFQNATGISIVAQITGNNNTIICPIIFNIYYFDDACITGDVTFPEVGEISFTLPIE